MRRTSRLPHQSPTRRQGPRTGAIPVDPALVERMMRAILRKAKETRRGLAFDFMSDVPYAIRKADEARGIRRSVPVKVGTYKVEVYATGKPEKIALLIGHDSEVEGRTGLDTGDEIEPSKAEKLKRVKEALRKLKVTVPKSEMEELTDAVFSWKTELFVFVSVPEGPLGKDDINKIRATLVHELIHVADEARRRGYKRDSEKNDALSDVENVAEQLGLGEYIPKKSEMIRASPTDGAAYANDPREVTAQIGEIMHEIGSMDNLARFRLRRLLEGRPGIGNRSQELIAFFRWMSPTFRDFSSDWTPKSRNRVLKALWDRYHMDEWFPEAKGILKNRRTSRRTSKRTSRRRR
jgi:hypothetical protein